MSLFRPLRLYGVLLASLGVVIAVALFTPVADDALTRTAYGWIAGVAVFIAATVLIGAAAPAAAPGLSAWSAS
jgi:hypothetical protein